MANKIQHNPVRSMNKLAKEHNMSCSIMQRLVKEDLRHQSYKIQKQQLLSEATKQKRMKRAKILKCWLMDHHDIIILYTDMKLFNEERKYNKQNTGVLSRDISAVNPSDMFAFMKQKPDSVMIWAVAALNGKKSPIFRIPEGVKSNQYVYLNFLKETVKPWIESEFPEIDICFMQDSAPAHGAKHVQAWCKANFQHFWPKEWWPPSSPDCNPLDFAM